MKYHVTFSVTGNFNIEVFGGNESTAEEISLKIMKSTYFGDLKNVEYELGRYTKDCIANFYTLTYFVFGWAYAEVEAKENSEAIVKATEKIKKINTGELVEEVEHTFEYIKVSV